MMNKNNLKGICIIFLLVSIIFLSSIQIALSVAPQIVGAVGGCGVGALLSLSGQCKLYNPKGDDCGQCGKYPTERCTEYICESINEECEFIPFVDSTVTGVPVYNYDEGYCQKRGEADGNPPVITNFRIVDMETFEILECNPLSDGLVETTGGTIISPDRGRTRGGGTIVHGTVLTNLASQYNNCEFGPLIKDRDYAFVLNTDEPADCRLGWEPTTNYHLDKFYEELEGRENFEKNYDFRFFSEIPKGLKPH